MSDADRMLLSYVQETVYGQPPSPAAQLTDVRYTSESIKQDTATAESSEIRADRETSDVIRTGRTASGDISFELSAGTLDEFFLATLQDAAWNAGFQVSGNTYSMDDADNSINDSGNQFIVDGFVVGQWIKVGGYATAANNKVGRIVSVTAGKMVLEGLTVVTEAAGPAVDIDVLEYIRNGTTQRSYTFEKNFTDLAADDFAYFTGMEFNTMSIEVPVDGIITGTVGLMGSEGNTSQTTVGTGTNVPTNSNEVLAAVEDVNGIMVDGVVSCYTNFSIEINNNLRTRMCIGQLNIDSVGNGKLNVSGSITAYFRDATLIDKYLAFDSVALGIIVEDEAGNVLVIYMPATKFTSGQAVASGVSTDIMAEMAYAAFRDGTLGFTVEIARFDAP